MVCFVGYVVVDYGVCVKNMELKPGFCGGFPVCLGAGGAMRFRWFSGVV